MTDLKDQLFLLATRVKLLEPDRHDPNKFHEDKSEIANELRKLAREERAGT